MELQYKSIGVVDDEEDIITLFTAVLHENGYHIIGFTNPLLALDYIHKHPDEFDLIIIDYRMSPMLGCELSIQISTINPKIKMVLITAYDNVIKNDLKTRNCQKTNNKY